MALLNSVFMVLKGLRKLSVWVSTKNIFVFFLIFGVCFLSYSYAFEEDTSQYFPSPQDLPSSPNWQVVNKKVNLSGRDFKSQTQMGYRYILDYATSPKTGLSFFVVVTKIRHGKVIDAREGLSVTKAQYAFKRMYETYSTGMYQPAIPLKYGDESFESWQDAQHCMVFVRRGDYLIDIRGTDFAPYRKDKPSLRDMCHTFAEFIDGRIFGVRLGKFFPIQAVGNVPLVAGKKMAIYIGVEVRKGRNISDYIYQIKVGRRGFSRTSYEFPLNLKNSLEYDPVGDTSDGTVWNKEFVEPISIEDAKKFFDVRENQEYDTYFYRIFLDPKKPNFSGNYIFRVTVKDNSSSKLREKVLKFQTRKSPTLRIAIVPLPIGYWAPPSQWKFDAEWIRRMKDKGWKRIIPDTFLVTLPQVKRNLIIGSPSLKKALKKSLREGRGHILYFEKTKKACDFLKGVMPVAEEKFEVYTYDDFPSDLKISSQPNSIEEVLRSLENWRRRHPRFQRVIGVIAGGNPLTGGISFYIDENTGRNFWFKKKIALVSVDEPVFSFAHQLLHTFGAYDEWADPSSEKRPLLNSPMGVIGGEKVIEGFWVQKKEYQGTHQKPCNSVMGKIPPAWITPRLYKGLMKVLKGY